MGGRTTDKTLSPKRTHFQEESATHILHDCEAKAFLRFRQLERYSFLDPIDYHDTRIRKVLLFTRSGGLTGE
jgi:hypothetical protein